MLGLKLNQVNKRGHWIYRDGVLVASDPNARYSPYTYTGLDNVFLGKHIAVYGEYGEAYVDELIVYEHMIDTEFVKYICLSYFYQLFCLIEQRYYKHLW